MQDVQDNHDGLHGHGAQFPAANPPEAFPGVWPHPPPPADIPLAHGLRILVGRILGIQPGPGGRLEVLIALELAG